MKHLENNIVSARTLENLIGTLENRIKEIYNQGYNEGYKDATKALDKKPKWELVGSGFVICSECKKSIGQAPLENGNENGLYDFCPNCGADMRGEK